MVKLTIDGNEVEVEPGLTIMQACEEAGVEIPRFCYHERLSIAGNCRMCLVDVEKSPKPIASCAMPVNEGMVVHTNTEKVKKDREGVLEFLLVNHPLDCPICDQGGECDLQDQTMAYGTSSNRYEENKRAVEDKNMGPLVSTIMTRCIHCTRCVRFTEEVAGVGEIGAIGRGEDMEITTYLEANLSSELSANVIDLCPVGALTSRPYAFNARPWELRKTESVDVMDGMGAAIRVDSRGREVMRVLPRLNEEINEEWISDKTRYACDGLKYQRLDQPYVKGADGKLVPADWEEALAAAGAKLKATDASKVAALAGDLQDAESMLALKDLMGQIGSPNLDCRPAGSALDATNRASYLFNAGIAGVEDADAILLIGTNPRLEAPVLNARIRKRWLDGGLQVGVIGENADLTYKTTHLGAGPQTLAELAAGNHSFCDVLKNADNPLIIVGENALTRTDGAQVLGAARTIADAVGAVKDGWTGFGVLHTSAARVGGLDMGFVPQDGGMDTAAIAAGGADVVIALGADEIDLSQAGAFIIYIGTHGDNGAHLADIILPAAAYTEKDGTYVNMEGRVQRGFRAAFAPGDAKEDWAIIRALSAQVGEALPYDSLEQLRTKLAADYPTFGVVDALPMAEWGTFGTSGLSDGPAFESAVRDFYLTNPIARASRTMAECVKARDERTQATHASVGAE